MAKGTKERNNIFIKNCMLRASLRSTNWQSIRPLLFIVSQHTQTFL